MSAFLEFDPVTDVITDLSTVDTEVLYLFAMVGEGLAAATAAFLDGDRAAAHHLAARCS